MNRTDLIRRAKAILAEAYDEAASMVMLYLDAHPSEALQPLCQEIDADNWNGLRRRVQRALEARKAAQGTELERAAVPEWKARDTKCGQLGISFDPQYDDSGALVRVEIWR